MTVRSASALTLLVVLCLAASAQGSSDRDTHLHHQDDAQVRFNDAAILSRPCSLDWAIVEADSSCAGNAGKPTERIQ